MEYRGLEGFIASISPFNFTAIGGNLSATPTLMGNVSLWKPASTAVLSNWTLFKVFREAGIPDGVINFLPSKGADFGDTVTSSPHLAGISFTGSGGYVGGEGEGGGEGRGERRGEVEKGGGEGNGFVGVLS